MWAELIDNNLLSDSNTTVNVHDVLNIIQRIIVLWSSLAEVVSVTTPSSLQQCMSIYYWQDQEPVSSRGPCQKSDLIKPQIMSVIKRQFILQIKGERPTILSPTKEVLDQLRQARELLLLSGLDVTFVELHMYMPVSGTLVQFVQN